MKRQKIFAIFVIAVFLFLLIAMIVQLFPLIRGFFTSAGEISSIMAYVDAFGWRGVPALIGLSTLQIIIPVIPAPAVGLITGLSYGIYWGPLIFLSGIVLGNIFVVVSVRMVHNLFETKNLWHKEQLAKIKRPEIIAFFFALIPWVSAVGPYLFAETKVSLGRYIIAVIAGSIPFTIIYVFLGDRISRGSYTMAIITAAVIVAALVFILLFRKKIMRLIMEESDA